MLAALTGLFAGWLYRTDTRLFIPFFSRRRVFRPLKSYRIPLSIHLLLARVLDPLIGSSAPPKRTNRVLPGQISDSSARTTVMPQPSLRSLLAGAGRMREGAARRTPAGQASRPVQNVIPAAAGTGGARAAMGEWVSEMAGRGGAGTRAPSEEEIAT